MRKLFLLLACAATLFTAGCSSYDQRFASAARSDVKRVSHEGAYSGRWVSASHPGGGGGLRCILTRVEGTEDLRADFHATWHGFSSEHVVVLHTKSAAGRNGGVRKFSGTSKLRTPIGAGTYSCEGTLDSRVMRACYDATYDRGTMEMIRVPSAAAKRQAGRAESAVDSIPSGT